MSSAPLSLYAARWVSMRLDTIFRLRSRTADISSLKLFREIPNSSLLRM